MISKKNSRFLSGLAAALATIATFAKTFAPFYLIGSTAIFSITCALGALVIGLNWRPLADVAKRVREALIAISLLYSVVIASYFANSFSRVPVTYLIGILIFHGLFILFGLASACGLTAVLSVLLVQATIYCIVFAQYTARFGDFVRNGHLQDVFGIGFQPLVIAIHQEIGNAFGLAALAAFGVGLPKARILALAALPFVMLLLFHLQARTAIVALTCSVIFLMYAGVLTRSRRLALAGLGAALIAAAFSTVLLYKFAASYNVSPTATDAISRTILEIQDQNPQQRIGIWTRTFRRIEAEPDRLLVLGRGIGTFPIDEGFGAPDWLLHKTEAAKYSPHNVHLELLYETGILGLLIFSALTFFPLIFALRYWHWLSLPEKAAMLLYVFYLVSIEISGSFAFDYDFQFFLGLAIGVVSLKRKEFVETRALLPGDIGSDRRREKLADARNYFWRRTKPTREAPSC